MNQLSKPDQGNTSFIILISCIATIGGFLFGFDSGVINGTVDGLKIAFQSDTAGTGFNVASMLLGCAIGAFFAGRMADIYGRRTILLLSAIIYLITSWGAGIADSSFEFVAYRLVGGLAVGAASVMAPAYISEVAPAHYRGRLATIQQIAIITGLFVAFLSNYLLAQAAGSASAEFWLGFEAWRWMFWVEIVPSAIFFLSLLLIPESPRYLVAQGRKDDALDVLTRLYGTEQGNRKYHEIKDSLSENRPRLSDLFDKVAQRIRPIVWVGIGLAVFQQLVGINVVFYYGAVLWQAVGFSEGDALLINVISGGLSIGACIISLLLVDKIGRRPLLWVGSVGMAVTLALLVGAFSSATQDATGQLRLSDNMGVLALVAANLYVVFFNASWGPVMWVMLGEMFPNQIRGSGLAVAGLAQWGSNFIVILTFPLLLASIGLAGAYGIYTFCALVSVFFVIKYVKETKQKELEQMEG
ncbi:sugar porter family MFS transporter [Cellvibrio polysaccharolyticus]|uniref:D-xylose-proton symporter n=1 Tax=Cellvibrio polysaccharolyticus TaxID=2082724 RepID=A0A928YV88_9GAMM|nr:sugar porter family MFS transporter [Cellvibrio polysaccharolyticus]MBE8718782.1 MFS transporter [Cellvibrio polysaccharolyticus]